MTVSSEFLHFLADQLAAFGEISWRRMFGGAGLYHQGIIFAIVVNDQLYLKADDVNRPDFEAQGMTPFKPFDDKPTTMSYWRIHDHVIDDPETLSAWSRGAWEAGFRAEKSKKIKGKKTKSRKYPSKNIGFDKL